MRRAAAALVLALHAATGIAAQPWSAEPTAVLGFELGAPLPDLRECMSAAQRNYVLPQRICIDGEPFLTDGRTLYSFMGIPMRDILSGLKVFQYEGATEVVYAIAPHDAYERLKAAATEKYGAPTEREVLMVRTKVGIEWPAEALTWTGAKVLIQLRERYGSVDKSALLATHIDTAAKRLAATEKSVSKAAVEL